MCEQGGNIKCVNRWQYRVCKHGGNIVCEQGGNIVCEQVAI